MTGIELSPVIDAGIIPNSSFLETRLRAHNPYQLDNLRKSSPENSHSKCQSSIYPAINSTHSNFITASGKTSDWIAFYELRKA